MIHDYEKDKCELCGSEAHTMSVLIQGVWTRICKICYASFAIEPQEVPSGSCVSLHMHDIIAG